MSGLIITLVTNALHERRDTAMFNVQALLESLPMMGYGMLGIFIAIFAIILTVAGLGKIFPAKK